jgi:hypothetical protein
MNGMSCILVKIYLGIQFFKITQIIQLNPFKLKN